MIDNTYIDSIKEVRKETDSIILFHSGTGKDSTVLLDILTQYFNKVVPVFLYVIKDLEHIDRHIAWAQRKYGVQFIKTPHFALYSFIKYGFLGCQCNPKQKLYKFSDIDKMVREKTGINWSCYGFKKSDSLNRRLMLGGYEMECINRTTNKLYPLSHWLNGDCVDYIKQHNLLLPEKYGKGQSNGDSPDDLGYLLWLRENSPRDLERVFEQFPYSKAILFEHDYKLKNG